MIDRDAETDWLRSHLATDTECLLVLYGRRRVGKTTLVTSILDELDTPSFYYLCDERGTTQNARRFAEQCADTLDDIPPDVDSFLDAFEYLKRRLDGRAVVALDEFSYLVDDDDSIPSVFQTIADDTIEDTGISLVLLGSSISMMEEGVLSYESPLYGRRTGQWRMEPMTLGDATGFFPDYTATELVEAYSILGGIPAYLEQFDRTQSLLENIERFVLSKGAFLYEEPEFLLRQELREPPTYMAILEAIAGGATRVSEIGNEIGRDASSLSRYLQNLTRLALVERETPVTDPDGRGVYRITDQFLRFWFRYVLPNRATLEQGHTDPVLDAIEETLPEHTSWTFETVCRQATRTPAFPVSCSRVGRWWYGGDEIDVAGIDEQSETLLLGECKWTTDVVGRGLLEDVEALEGEVRWHGNDRSVEYALFARAGFTDPLEELAADREDLWLFTPTDVLEVFESNPDQ
ncbi:ATP-binding protein [Halorubellus salinus]|uniref:ATP-binding protein n=1 Tax=Halorubellus salinus TaxID=755309 RepID=UPI001D08F3A2|nr:ATP-binding protein [Halorubellus salinus]